MNVPPYDPNSDVCPWAIVTTTGVAECDDHDWIEVYDHAHNGEWVGPCSTVWNYNHPHAFDRSRVPHDPCPTCDGWGEPATLSEQWGDPVVCPDCTDGFLHDPWCPCQPPVEMIGRGSVLAPPRGTVPSMVLHVEDGWAMIAALTATPSDPAIIGTSALNLAAGVVRGLWRPLYVVPPMPEVTP